VRREDAKAVDLLAVWDVCSGMIPGFRIAVILQRGNEARSRVESPKSQTGLFQEATPVNRLS